MVRQTGLSKWQYALLIGTPFVIGTGYWYYRRRQSRSKVDEANDIEIEPVDEALTCKNKGNKYFKGGKYDEAIKCYTEAIKLCPADKTKELSTFYQNRAAAYEHLKNFQQVIEDTTKAYELNKKYTKALYRRAKAHEQMKSYRKSLDDVTVGCILDAFQNIPAIMMIDRVLKLFGKQLAEEAIKTHVAPIPSPYFISNFFLSYHNDPLVSNIPEYKEGLSGYQKALYDYGQRKCMDVIADCTEEIDNDGDFKSDALLFRATFYLLRGQLEKAQQDLNNLLEMDEIKERSNIASNAFIKLAAVKVQEEDIEQCLTYFKEAINVDPDNPDIYLNRGQIYLLMDKVDESMKDLERAVSIAPEYSIAHIQYNYVRLRHATSNNKSAESSKLLMEFEKLQEKFPDCCEAFFLYAQVLAEQQEYAKAEKYCHKANQVAPDNPNVYIHLGLLNLHWKHNIDDAINWIKKGLEVDDKCVFGYETLGTIEVQRGNLDTGIDLFNEALKVAKSEGELAHLFSLREAAVAQQKAAKALGINIPIV